MGLGTAIYIVYDSTVWVRLCLGAHLCLIWYVYVLVGVYVYVDVCMTCFYMCGTVCVHTHTVFKLSTDLRLQIHLQIYSL